jgi:hypothetical protein
MKTKINQLVENFRKEQAMAMHEAIQKMFDVETPEPTWEPSFLFGWDLRGTK